MQKVQLILFLLLSVNLLNAQETPFLLFGGDKNDEGKAIIELEKEDGIVVLGSTRSFGEGSSDNYFLKFNAQFDLIAENTFGNEFHDRYGSAFIDVEGDFILFSSRYYSGKGGLNFNLVKFDMQGNVLKDKWFWRNKPDLAYKALGTSDGGFLLTGCAADQDSHLQSKILKMNSDWEIEFELQYGSYSVRDYGFDCLENDQGYLLLSNQYCEMEMSALFGGFKEATNTVLRQVNFVGEIAWEYTYEGEDFDYAFTMVQSDGFIYVAMNSRSGESESFDIRVLKLNLDGELVDSFDFGGEGVDYAYKIKSVSNGSLILCGSSFSTSNRPAFYAVNFSSTGLINWESRIEEEASIYAYDLIENKEGDFIFTGKYTQEFDNSEVFLLTLDKNGNAIYPPGF